MLKYNNYAITFSEIPDEICLYITITGCPIHCPECNSKWLWKNTGSPLSYSDLNRIIEENKGITCIVFGGGDGNISALKDLCLIERLKSSRKLKLAFYSGSKDIDLDLVKYLDYYKVGPFDSKYGPLNNPMTNQRLYKIEDNHLIDITYKFWK